MGKLFNLKEWLTLADAARHLSNVFSEDVTEADVLRLALEGRLRLSVYFVNYAKARCGKVVGYEDVEWGEFSADLVATIPNIPDEAKGKPLPYIRSLSIDNERFLNLSDDVTTLRGVWDLPMIGNERLDVEHEYQNLTGGPAVTLQGLDGAFVEGRDGQICQLQENYDDNEYQPGSRAQLERLKQNIAKNGIKGKEAESVLSRHKEERQKFLEQQRTRPAKDKYYPAGGLPDDSVLVVRTDALREFEQTLNGASLPIIGGLKKEQETPAARRERINARRDQLKRERIRNFLQVLAEEEGVSIARIKQILSGSKSLETPWFSTIPKKKNS